MNDPVIELDGVAKDYGATARTRVLDDVDLRVQPGELAAIVGPSGSGKSTLLNLLGLLDRPTEGTIRVLGRDTATLDERERTRLRGRSIGFVFQFHHLVPALRALENVRLPLVIHRGRIRPEMTARALEGLARVGLAHRANARIDELSGGEQQRVAIARALVLDPPLVLADEPTGNLDTQSSDRVFDLLRKVNREHGTAMLVVTHDPRIADRCDRVVTLVDGRIESDLRRDQRP